MKVALIMIMCSQIAGECSSPHFLRHYDNFYECLLGGYQEAIDKTKELGKKEIVSHEVVIKFNCYYDPKTNHPGAQVKGYKIGIHKSRSGGLTKKGVAKYRRENPGSKLKMAVTTKPSKLKKGSKAAKRRIAFCKRMLGMKKRRTSAKTARDPNSRINKALRKWNC